jgi:hypothetical protein
LHRGRRGARCKQRDGKHQEKGNIKRRESSKETVKLDIQTSSEAESIANDNFIEMMEIQSLVRYDFTAPEHRRKRGQQLNQFST